MLSIRVLFVVTGFGYGDTVRVKAILDELSKEVKNLSAMFLGYDHSYKYFNKKYPTFRISGYNFPDSGMEFKTNRFLIKNFYLPITWLKDYMKHKKTIEKFNTNIIISDFEPVANIIARRLKKRCISIFGYDPVLFEKYNKKNSILNVQAKYIEGLYNKSDLVIIPTFRKKDDYSNVKYVNPIVSTGPDDLQSKPELMKKLKLKKEPILVMLGGSNYGVGLAKRILKETVNFNEDFIFFGSKKSIAGFHFKFAKNFLEYLKASKAVITLGGKLTLSECLVFKKPMLIFPIRNHVEQVLNAYSVRNVSMQGDFKKIKDSISIFLNNLESLNEKLKLLDVKPTGAKEAANIILEEITRE